MVEFALNRIIFPTTLLGHPGGDTAPMRGVCGPPNHRNPPSLCVLPDAHSHLLARATPHLFPPSQPLAAASHSKRASFQRRHRASGASFSRMTASGKVTTTSTIVLWTCKPGRAASYLGPCSKPRGADGMRRIVIHGWSPLWHLTQYKHFMRTTITMT